MSSQKGNASRTRAQKHQNRTVFKNNLHDKSHTTKFINNIVVSDVCQRCKEIIEWKIKYKKYKPLTQPKSCVKCGQKSVKHAYHVMCLECGKKLGQCTKCCESKEVIQPANVDNVEKLRQDQELQSLLKSLSERKRRTFIRYMNNDDKKDKINIADKLKSLAIENDDKLSDIEDYESDIDDEFLIS